MLMASLVLKMKSTVYVIPRFLLKSFSLRSINSIIVKSYANTRCILTNENICSYNLLNKKENNDVFKKDETFKKNSWSFTTVKNYSSVSNISHVLMDDARQLEALFPVIVQDLVEWPTSFVSKDTGKWFRRALEYNVPKGRQLRALLMTSTYKSLTKDVTPANMRLAYILGWCLELQQSYLLLYDDVIDESTMRRSQLCWHKLDDVGLIAVNDIVLIGESVYFLLRKYFSHLECYTGLVNSFHEFTYVTAFGQSLDMLSSQQNVETFSRENYLNITTYKSAYYSWYMPVVVAMHLANYKNVEATQEARDILLNVGVIFQAQNDFLDCFDSPLGSHKLGTDIESNKISWLSVECMCRANEEQKAIMLECHGKKDPQMVARVKQLYSELNLPAVYADYEKKSLNQIEQALKQAGNGVPKKVIKTFLDIIFAKPA